MFSNDDTACQIKQLFNILMILPDLTTFLIVVYYYWPEWLSPQNEIFTSSMTSLYMFSDSIMINIAIQSTRINLTP